MKITIIGSGYVGKRMAEYWAKEKKGLEITITTTREEKVAELEKIAQKVVVTKGEDREGMKRAIEGANGVLLCMAPGRFNQEGDRYESTYLETAKTVRELVKEENSIGQVIYTGVYSIVSDKKGEWVDEESPVMPKNERGRILWETEKTLLAIQQPTLTVCILRLGGIYGPGREIRNIFQSWMGTTKPGTGEDYQNWVHQEDIIRGIDFAWEKNLGGIYNLVCDQPIQKKELLDGVAKDYNLPPVQWDGDRSKDSPYNIKASNQKLKKEGFSFLYPKPTW